MVRTPPTQGRANCRFNVEYSAVSRGEEKKDTNTRWTIEDFNTPYTTLKQEDADHFFINEDICHAVPLAS